MNAPAPPHVRDDAAAYLQAQLERTQAASLVLSLRRTGCSGWSYALDEHDGVPQDAIRASGRVPLYVFTKDLPLLAGTLVRLERLPLGMKVAFDNPQETGACGCGASVALAGPVPENRLSTLEMTRLSK